ncbi:penicillin acylase family protein [Pelagibacterium lacus]|nr:penicillin acylase family protein [Pelagibacterium lacus]
MSSAVRWEQREVPGLEDAAEIIIDQWGISHIYAESDRDALFLQGYNAASDRLWQIDLWRKRGLGLLSENFGASYVDQDRAARMFLYRGDMDAEWAAYGPNGRTYAGAFVEGVNAYVQQVLDGELPLPVEFELTGTQPDLWSAEDAVRIRSHGLTRNASSEVRRSQIACAADLEADALRSRLEPAWDPAIPEGLDPCVIPPDVLRDYQLATQGVEFVAPEGDVAGLDYDQFLRATQDNVDRIGSNNWTIAPERTSTGRPILANDPHRAHGAPSLRYIVHLNSPDMSVIGAGEPALPGISIGHNGTIAFGLTIFAVDQEDVYVYELNPENPNQYRYNGEWEDMEEATETIAVRDGGSQDVTMLYTRHGPVLQVDEENNRAFAIRTVWLEPGTSAYFGSVDYMTAQNWDEFSTAIERFSTPSENQVYADTDGNIGWIVGAMTPTRENWDGLMPVPGDGTYEWDFLDRQELPASYNPEKGWFATANEMNLPDDFDYERWRIGFEWSDPSRYQRIEEVLTENDSVTLADAMALQNDDVSMLGRRLVQLVADIELVDGADSTAQAALALLQDWDGAVEVDSAPAVVSELMLRGHLGRATVQRAAPAEAVSLIGNGSISSVLALLENPDERLGDDPEAARGEILQEAFSAAVEEAMSLLGGAPEDWQWGALHKGYFKSNMVPLLHERMVDQYNVGPISMGGASSTPRAASYNANFEVTSGASFRMVLDVGNWDASRAINAPGQSGDPLSPHYRDLAPLWAAGEYIPLVYSREAVEANAARVLELSPGQ